MEFNAISTRPFIGAKDFDLSRKFYRDLGFEETILTPKMCVFKSRQLMFYLQDAYIQEWIDNTMIFVEVTDVYMVYEELRSLNLPSNYESVRLVPLRTENWGKECFLHDPSGVLWHFGEFSK